jgi:hypothetical protein
MEVTAEGEKVWAELFDKLVGGSLFKENKQLDLWSECRPKKQVRNLSSPAWKFT